MSAKEFLSRARNLQKRIDQLETARLRAWEIATSSTAPPGGSGRRSKGEVGRKADPYVEYTAKIDAEKKRLAEIKVEILGVISRVDDNTLSALLIAYYINGETWEQTAQSIHYSYSKTVMVKHPQALAVVENILSEKKGIEGNN